MEWQPIETAPKDGTRVLLAYDVRIGQRVAEGQHGGDMASEGEGWYCDVGRVPATHWMPLPDPPKA